MGVNATKESRNKYMREYYQKNKEAVLNYNRNYYQNNKKERSAYERARKYGLTVEALNEIVLQQKGLCPICKEILIFDTGDRSKVAHVDHDHKCCNAGSSCSKCIRGILCGRCNRALGAFGDSIELLLSAIEYLRKSSNERS